MTSEERYIRKRLREARRQAREFYYCRKYPIQGNKIVFTTIEGTTGFSCNPKYIALELLRRNLGLDLVWLVDDMTKEFPRGIRKVKNTLKNRAYELSTAKIWIDNSRKQLEVRKRPGQTYINTWHGHLAFKPVGLERGELFSKIAYLVSKHDSALIDYVITDSRRTDERVARSMLYDGEKLTYGMPRCDILLDNHRRDEAKRNIRNLYDLDADEKLLLYVPTFRGGSQGTNRSIEKGQHAPNFSRLLQTMTEKFGGRWTVLLRLHPQLTARHISAGVHQSRIVDVSKYDDMYELLAASDACLTDYSSAAFDAALTYMPVFIYADDVKEYEEERGSLQWDMRALPFPFAETDDELNGAVQSFNEKQYDKKLDEFFEQIGMVRGGDAAKKTADLIEDLLKK